MWLAQPTHLVLRDHPRNVEGGMSPFHMPSKITKFWPSASTRAAKSVVESVRGLHATHVFVRTNPKTQKSRPVTKMYNTAWKAARERAADAWAERKKESTPDGFRKVRVHDLKHTFAR